MDVTVRDVPDRNRYEAHLGDDLAGFIDYEHAGHGTVRVLVHTEVLDAFEGKGIGGALARYALDDLRERDIKARVLCPFIKSWIERHPAYQDQG
jgi:predicted GNAT family acetyltransferase